MQTATSLNIVTTSIGHEKLDFEVTLWGGQRTIVLSLDDFNRRYFELIQEKVGPLLETVLTNLIRTRDHLGLQLNFEFGNISESDFNQLELDFLTEPREIAPDRLSNDIDMLIRLSNRVYNAEELATMFNCTIEAAEKALGTLLIEEGVSHVQNS